MRQKARAPQLGDPMALAQELEKFDALTQSALHHLRTAHHLSHNRRDLRCAEIEALIESLDIVEDLGIRKMLIGQRRDLDPVLVYQFGVRLVEPAVLHRLAM